MDVMQQARRQAALAANAEDASLWRWFAYLLEERRIRWRWQFNSWLVYVDRTHVATEETFDRAVREAKATADARDWNLMQSKVHPIRRDSSRIQSATKTK